MRASYTDKAMLSSILFYLLFACNYFGSQAFQVSNSIASGVNLSNSIASESDYEDIAVTVDQMHDKLVFAVAFSFHDFQGRRAHMRKSWVGAGYDMKDGPVAVRFAVCVKGISFDELDKLRKENEAHNDLMLLNCDNSEQRYPPPATTMPRKLFASMETYAKEFRGRPVFMKFEDDTFVPWNRLLRFLHQHKSELGKSYIGMPIEGKSVNRNDGSPWFQPFNTYADKEWPTYMDKLGYLIGGDIVQTIVDNQIAQKQMVSCEDQAAGLWVHRAAAKKFGGMEVNFLTIPGRYDFTTDDPVTNGTWAEYTYLLQHNIKREYYVCLAEMDGEQLPQSKVSSCFFDSMFVAVFSARQNTNRRANLRTMYKELQGLQMVAKFVMCQGEDKYTEAIKKESNSFGDLLILPCQEGYSRTLLTKKVILSMKAYKADFWAYSLFMKVDDDTFVSFRRLDKVIKEAPRSEYGYFGIQGPGKVQVNRDPDSVWYQPLEDDVHGTGYPNESYPTYMEGGPGYILGREVVGALLDTGVAESHILSNEDQATGVWIDHLRARGIPVGFISILGTDGYRPQNDVCQGPWKDYPFFLHHKLNGSTIACLANLEKEDNENALIENCIDNCEDLTHTFLTERLDQIGPEIKRTVKDLEDNAAATKKIRDKMQWLHSKGERHDQNTKSKGNSFLAVANQYDFEDKYAQATGAVLEKTETLIDIEEEMEEKLKAATEDLLQAYSDESQKRDTIAHVLGDSIMKWH